ncbi:Coronin-2B [Halotydeus destructor]|nr:Coronin-2B [Halotydeus destructor]
MNRRSHTQPVLRIRSSKFKHVYCCPAKKEDGYDNLKITKNAHDSQFCAVNPKFVAVVTESSGGGSFTVIPVEHKGRLEVNYGRIDGHQGPVSDMKWCPFNDNVIATGSDDCTIKIWYVPDGGPERGLEAVMTLYEHKRRVAFIEWHPSADNILVSAGFDHVICIWNTSKGQLVRLIACHGETIQSISFNRDGSLLATTCKDKLLRIIDVRRGVVVGHGRCHEGSKAAKVAFLGDTTRLFTTGFSKYSDRQWAVWSQSDLSKPLRLENIDSSSGVLFPFYDHDTKMVYVAGKGDGSIRYYEVVSEAPWAFYISQYITGFPQRGLGIMPKRGLDTLKCEVFRFYKLHATKPLCEPLSMIVPRKSQLFQSDIFPPTAAPTPALTAEQWLSGKTCPPVLISMETAAYAKTYKPVTLKDDSSLVTGDLNNDRKFIFITQENRVDYRPKSSSPSMFNGHPVSSNGGSPVKSPLSWVTSNGVSDHRDGHEDVKRSVTASSPHSQQTTPSSPSSRGHSDTNGSLADCCEIIARQQQEIVQLRNQIQVKNARIEQLEAVFSARETIT